MSKDVYGTPFHHPTARRPRRPRPGAPSWVIVYRDDPPFQPGPPLLTEITITWVAAKPPQQRNQDS